jgi:hypothetical protein
MEAAVSGKKIRVHANDLLRNYRKAREKLDNERVL